MNAVKIIHSDLTHTHQKTSVALEIRTQAELDELIVALQNEDRQVVVLRDLHSDIAVSVYIRFREMDRSTIQ